MTELKQHETGPAHDEFVHLPAGTPWPLILAFGATLGFAGLVTNIAVTAFGVVLVLAACIGWFKQVLPHEKHVHVPVTVQPVMISSTRTEVARIHVTKEHRAHLPVEVYPITAGIKGGIAGGFAMILPAIIYGLITHDSIWYPINLLGGAGVAYWRNPTTAQIAAFHWQALLVATVIHGVACLLVGLLYGAMLPMLPRHPVLLGGVLAPVLWTGILHSFMGVINPAMDARIEWGWFVVSQVAFGLVAGMVVARDSRIRTGQSLPFVMRMGIEAPGLMHTDADDKEKH